MPFLGPPQSAQPLRQIGRDLGLPSGQVHSIAQGPDGSIWLAGPSGLAMYDGVRITSFGRTNGLSTQGLRSVAFSSDSLLIGSDLGIELRTASGKFVKLGGDWLHGFVECIEVTSSGAAWIGAARGLSMLTHDGQIEPVHNPRFENKFVRALMCDSRDRPHVLIGGTVVAMDGGWQQLRIESNLRVTAMCSDRTSRYFAVGTFVIELDLNGTEVGRASIPEAGDGQKILAVGDELWVATTRALYYFKRARRRWQLENTVLVGVQVNDLFCDSQLNVWVATDSAGAYLISALREAVRVRSPGRSGAAFSLAEHAGRFYVGGDGESWIDSGTLESIDGLEGQRVWDLRPDSAGRLWAATQAGLFGCDELGNWRPMHREVEVLDAPNRCLLPRHDGLLVGTVTGLAAINGSGARSLFDGGGPGYVYTIAPFGDDVLLGTVGNGLWLSDGRETLKRFAEDVIADGSNVYSVAQRSDGRLAISADDQIAIADGSFVRVIYRSAAAVAGWSVCWGSEGQLWVGSGAGLVELDGETGEVKRTIRSLLGYDGWEFTTSRSLLHLANGTLRCGVSGGVICLDPKALEAVLELPVAQPAGIEWHGLDFDPKQQTVTVPVGGWSAKLALSSRWFFDDDLWFQYRIVGLENDWLKAPPDAVVRLTALPPGDYQVQARAVTSSTGPGPMTRLLSLRVAAPWWVPTWVAPPVRLARRIGGALLGSSRNQDLLRENRELELQIRIRTREIEAINARLERANEELQRVSVTDPLTGVHNRRWLDLKLPQEIERCSRSGTAISVLMIDVDHFKAFNDRYGHLEGDRCLVMVAQRIASEVRSSMDVVARFGGEEFAVVLPNCPREAATTLAKRVGAAILDLGIEHIAIAGQVSVSVGVATLSNCAGARNNEGIAIELLQTADDALFTAKREGRNCVRWGELLPSTMNIQQL